MDLKSIFPPSYFESSKDLPRAMQILSTAMGRIHFERRKARNVGLRGINPFSSSAKDSLLSGWTCKILHAPVVYSVMYQGEVFPADLPQSLEIAYDKSTHWAKFALFGFPNQDDDILEDYPLKALAVAAQENYEQALRKWDFKEHEYAPFELGYMYMGIAGQGYATPQDDAPEKPCASEVSITLLLQANQMLKTICLDGVTYENEGKQEWLITPGGNDSKILAFELAEPLFDTFARTLGSVLEPDYTPKSKSYTHKTSSLAYNDQGHISYIENDSTMLYKIVSWGQNLIPINNLTHIQDFSLSVPEEFREDMPLIHIISGFLGSGKTTFLREWLAHLQNKDTYLGVIQNEFGQIGLDSMLLKEDTVVEALDEGCVCCSLADALRPGVQRIFTTMPGQDILLETSGVANPNNVATALKDLDDMVKLGLIISVSDAKVLSQSLKQHEHGFAFELDSVATTQIECVDIIVLNKLDLIDTTILTKLRSAITWHNKDALVIECEYGRIPFAMLDEMWDMLQLKKLNAPKALLQPFHHLATHEPKGGDAYTSKVIYFNNAIKKEDIEAIVHKSQAVRVKGILDVVGEGQCILHYAAGEITWTPVYFAMNDEKYYLVFIGKNIDSALLNTL